MQVYTPLTILDLGIVQDFIEGTGMLHLGYRRTLAQVREWALCSRELRVICRGYMREMHRLHVSTVSTVTRSEGPAQKFEVEA